MFEKILSAVEMAKWDYRRYNKREEDVGILSLYVETLKNPVFGSIFNYRILSALTGDKLAFWLGALILGFLVRTRKDIEISFLSRIDKGLVIYHGSGLVIGEGVVAGKGLVLESGVVLGNRIGSSAENAMRFPVLGDNVFIGCGAKVLGPVQVGNNVKIGSNSVVLKEVPDNSTVVGIPGRVIT